MPLPALGLSELGEPPAYIGFESTVSIASCFFLSLIVYFLKGPKLCVKFELIKAERLCLWKMSRTKLEDSGWKESVQRLWLGGLGALCVRRLE